MLLDTCDADNSHYRCLKTADEVHEERMSPCIHDFKDVFLRHEALDLIASKNVGFLQRFYCKVFAGRQMLRQHNLHNHGKTAPEVIHYGMIEHVYVDITDHCSVVQIEQSAHVCVCVWIITQDFRHRYLVHSHYRQSS